MSNKPITQKPEYKDYTVYGIAKKGYFIDDLEKYIDYLEGCHKRCRDDAYKLLMAVSTPIGPDDFDRLIDDMKRIGEDQPS